MFSRIIQWIRGLFSPTPGGKFLCDSCQYDYRTACRNPERPNAKKCSDYKRRG